MGDLDRHDGDQGGSQADQHMRPQPGRTLPPFALEADDAAQHRSQDQPRRDDREWQPGLVPEFGEQIFQRSSLNKLVGSQRCRRSNVPECHSAGSVAGSRIIVEATPEKRASEAVLPPRRSVWRARSRSRRHPLGKGVPFPGDPLSRGGKPHRENLAADALRKLRRELQRRAALDGIDRGVDEPPPRSFVADDVDMPGSRVPEDAAVTPEAERHRHRRSLETCRRFPAGQDRGGHLFGIAKGIGCGSCYLKGEQWPGDREQPGKSTHRACFHRGGEGAPRAQAPLQQPNTG